MTWCEDNAQICELYDWIEAWMSEKHISALAAAERIHDNLESALQDYLDDLNDGRGYVA